jgi:excinuclease ABC subunit A
VCGGSRFRAEAERVRVRGLSMADVLAASVEEAAGVFRALPRARRPLQAAVDVGLGYVPLGESTARLSGGEALRLRLAAALGRGGRTRTLYVLDEPCAGLHPLDASHLADVLVGLTAAGNAVLAVEHNPLLIRRADHAIELGPGPGAAGGRVVFEGTPADLLLPKKGV